MKYNNFLFFAVAIATLFTVSACTKEDIHTETDTEAPALTISTPTATSVWHTADSVAVKGLVSDNDALHELTIELRKAGSSTVIWTKTPTVHDLKTYTIDQKIPNGLAISNYVLTTTAEDHSSNKTVKVVEFTVN